MKIVFVSNFLNHHQIPFCKAMEKSCDEFYFVATDSCEGVGYQRSSGADFVVNWFDINNRDRAENLILSADAVIFGACPDSLIEKRMRENKLSFFASERFFKKGTWRRFIPTTRKKIINRIVKYKKKNIYVLCASAYLKRDLALLGYPEDKCYKWGYFPETKQYENIDDLLRKKDKSSILWAARFLDWKHPELVVKTACKLKKAGYNFTINMIGDGVLKAKTEKLINKYNLSDCVKMLGSRSSEYVREKMEQSGIFLMTSDRNEGWGATLNEAMNSGCAAVANIKAGAVPYLMKDKQNGFAYKNKKELFNAVKMLLDSPDMQQSIGKAAYKTITDEWCAEIAAERFIKLCSQLKNRKDTLYKKGPCSKA